MALTQKDLDLIVKALEPRFELLECNLTQRIDQLEVRVDQMEENLTQRIDQLEVRVDQVEENLTRRIDLLENDLIKSVAKELMPQIEDHERRISKLENARVVS